MSQEKNGNNNAAGKESELIDQVSAFSHLLSQTNLRFWQISHPLAGPAISLLFSGAFGIILIGICRYVYAGDGFDKSLTNIIVGVCAFALVIAAAYGA